MRRLFTLLLALSLLCSFLPAAFAEEEPTVTALCVAEPRESVFLDGKEFQTLCRQATGHDLECVTFSSLSPAVGKLTYRGEKITAGTPYYMYRKPSLSQLCFTPYFYSDYSDSQFTGQAELAFTMTSDKDETVSGALVFYVPESSPASGDDSCMDKTVRVKTGETIDLCDHLPSDITYRVGGTVHSGEPITSATVQLPSSSLGSLWLDYDHPEAARKLFPNEVLFPDRAPNYHNLTFVPAGKQETSLSLHYTVSSERKKDLNVCLTLDLREDKEPLPPVPDIPDDGIGSPGILFQDMAGWEWAEPAAEFLAKNGYRSGEVSFSPGNEATRMDLIHALALTAYCNSRRNAPPPPLPDFSDLPTDESLALSAAILADRGVVLGNGSGFLFPDMAITRQDALVILYRAMVDRRKTLPLYGDLSAFSDAGEVAPYAQEAVTLLAARGIVLGNGSGELEPLSPITRAEMACLLYRAFGG